MRPLQAHYHRSFGTLYAQASQVERARVEISIAMEMYHAMGVLFWLPQAETILMQLEPR
jgi:hypothetical protein